MLVLSRKTNETIKIGEDIEIRVLEIKGESVRLGIEAPKTTEILRGELILSITETNKESTIVDESLFARLTKKE